MKNMIKLCSLSVLLIAVIAGCSLTANQGEQAQALQAKAKDIGQRVAKWQVGHLENNNYDYLAKRYRRGASDARNWLKASFYIGLTHWVETVGDKEILAHIEKMAAKQKYRLKPKKLRHADHHAIAQTYLWLAEQTGNQQAYQPTKKIFDDILASPSTGSLEMVRRAGNTGSCQERWCWSDALFMAPRVWMQMSKLTGDPRYLEFADDEMWATVDYLFSEQHGLFYRDSTYFSEKSDNGQPVFWGRGNGWVFAALPLMLETLPADHPSRAKYLDLYRKNAQGLVKAQTAEGYWAPSLLDPEKVKNREVSATGFVTYGLAWGINNGILTGDEYKQAALKGWQVIETSVESNGRVNWVQQVGEAPAAVKKSDTQLYGAGAVLLAASEMTKWTQTN